MHIPSDNPDIVIIGAGVAGLSCAIELQKAELPFQILEASANVGGRINTDEFQDFRLDRGFQVFQSAYPEAREILDFGELELIELEPGAQVRKDGRWHCMTDPWRRPTKLWATLANRIGTLSDRWHLLKHRSMLKKQSVAEILTALDDMSTNRFLRERVGFSNDFIESFVRPWLAGIFLESDLETSANYFRFVFKMLSEAPVCLPAGGISKIPSQLASHIDASSLRLNTRVQSVSGNEVKLQTGEMIKSRAVVFAAGVESANLCDGDGTQAPVHWNGTTCIYFASDTPPTHERALMLNGEGEGPANHVFIPTNSDPSLSKGGRCLISVSLIGSNAVETPDLERVLVQMREWFGEHVSTWQHLRNYWIPNAVPQQMPGAYRRQARQQSNGPYVCGDIAETASLNGALQSGRQTARAIIDSLR